MIKLDDIDYQLLELLQKDASRGIKELALHVGLTATPVYERVKKMESAGVIQKYGISLDRKQLGLGLTVFCQVSLQTHSKSLINRFEIAVQRMDEVAEMYHTSGEFDYLLKVVCKDNKQYHDFIVEKLSALEMVAKVQSNFVLAEPKQFEFYRLSQ
jgi:DNA-binding Lrp family transcriptional regulator